MKYLNKEETQMLHSPNTKGYPSVIDLDSYYDYNKGIFSNWPTVIFFETLLHASHQTWKESGVCYMLHMSELSEKTGLPEETCKQILKRFINLGIVKGFGHHEEDFIEDDDYCIGYYRFDYERIVKILPFLLNQPRDKYANDRYKERLVYLMKMHGEIKAFLRRKA